MFGMNSEYNYEHFTKGTLMRELLGARSFGGPKPGERAPDFELRSLEGDLFRLRNLRGKRNVVLMFGSATCPMTAGSLHGLNPVVKKFRKECEFVLVYVREAHPGDEIRAHADMNDKLQAAELLRNDEKIALPILIDDVSGTVHRKFGSMPNPAYLIDRSGRVAFRALWAEPHVIEEAVDQLLAVQERRGVEHAVVLGGEDKSMPMSYPALYSYRALHRGGRRAIRDFERALGIPGKMVVASSRVIGPVKENPGRTALAAALGVGVLAGGLYAGRALRRRRLAPRSPYQNFSPPGEEEEGGDYGVVGI